MWNATLPDGLLPETDVQGMTQFLSTLITPKLHDSFFPQVSRDSRYVYFCK